ncbi:DUF5652 family protein [Leifsonia sp. Root4]|uniref:DUF5652 family protein n=1 Tax=Leifsonia sp. Root4 TaxID=1736525 RepID=UPI000A9250E5|nr:DUF5652 family protein [Leifsonia sp. Root4]
MKHNQRHAPAQSMSEHTPAARGLFLAALVWSLGWKAASLWQAARDGRKPWFVALLVTNTLGILDAIYLFKISGARSRTSRAEAQILTQG